MPVPVQMWEQVPVQMWEQRAQSRCRCGRGEPSPGADVAGVATYPVTVSDWIAGRATVSQRSHPSPTLPTGFDASPRVLSASALRPSSTTRHVARSTTRHVARSTRTLVHGRRLPTTAEAVVPHGPHRIPSPSVISH